MDRGTVAVYEQRAKEWRDRRPARFADLARALAHELSPGSMRLDVGCGAGLHLEHLGRPVVALDAAHAMVTLAREAAPEALGVQADLEALPLRRGSIAGSWARASYLHVPRTHLPLALRELHGTLAVGAPAAFTMLYGTAEGQLADDDFAGRFFAEWESDPLSDVFLGAGFSIDTMDHQSEWINVHATRLRTLPDVVGPDMRFLVCGLNPSLYAADAGVGFARPGNRFWPAALAAGLVSRDRDPGYALRHHGMGMTDLVKRATVSAAELSKQEYADGMARVERLVRWFRPGVVCFVGLAGWRSAVDKKATAGEQSEDLGGVPVYVMPNPSGLNANHKLDDFVRHLKAAMVLSDSNR